MPLLRLSLLQLELIRQALSQAPDVAIEDVIPAQKPRKGRRKRKGKEEADTEVGDLLCVRVREAASDCGQMPLRYICIDYYS